MTSFPIASRKSNLALIQTHHIKDILSTQYPDKSFEVVHVDTKGDQILDVSLSKIGSKGLFTAALEAGILDGRYRFAVHSLKDLPTSLDEGLALGAITAREDPRDVLLVRNGLAYRDFSEMPEGSVIGSSSLRRIAQLKHMYPHLEFKDIRGNLNTRLAKLDNEELGYTGMILAYAGVKRMGSEFVERVTMVIDEMYYAPGQGALGIECAEGDEETLSVLATIHDDESYARCKAERTFLNALGGGCQVPLGVKTNINNEALTLQGIVLSLDGTKVIKHEVSGNVADPIELGNKLAEEMKSKGAMEILKEVLENQ